MNITYASEPSNFDLLPNGVEPTHISSTRLHSKTVVNRTPANLIRDIFFDGSPRARTTVRSTTTAISSTASKNTSSSKKTNTKPKQKVSTSTKSNSKKKTVKKSTSAKKTSSSKTKPAETTKPSSKKPEMLSGKGFSIRHF